MLSENWKTPLSAFIDFGFLIKHQVSLFAHTQLNLAILSELRSSTGKMSFLLSSQYQSLNLATFWPAWRTISLHLCTRGSRHWDIIYAWYIFKDICVYIYISLNVDARWSEKNLTHVIFCRYVEANDHFFIKANLVGFGFLHMTNEFTTFDCFYAEQKYYRHFKDFSERFHYTSSCHT